MPLRYSIYGLQLSANHLIPGLLPTLESAPNSCKVRICFNLADHYCRSSSLTETEIDRSFESFIHHKSMSHSDRSMRFWEEKTKIIQANSPQSGPWYTGDGVDEHGIPVLLVYRTVNNEFFRFHYSDGVVFIVDRTGSQIEISWPETSTVEDVATYLLGPILGFVLCLRKIVCLHASAVVIGNQAIALLGPAGAGKSTTAAAFAMQGYSVLTEDVLALQEQDGDFLVQPGYPLLRLWPESVKALFNLPEALPRLTPNWEKRYLDLTTGAYRFHGQPQPLAAIYILGERSLDADAPFIEAVSNREGLITLIGNTYSTIIRDMLDRAQEFRALSRIAASVPLRLVRPHTDPARLPGLCRAIIEDFTNLRYE